MSLQQSLGGLVGEWSLEGEILGKRLVQEVSVGWVLGGAYLHMHYLPSTVTPLTDQPYEAIAFIGWLPEGKPIMHLFDTFGARFSAPGIGEVIDDRLRFHFDYADGQFVTDLLPTSDGWTIEQWSIDSGERVPFGVKRLTRH